MEGVCILKIYLLRNGIVEDVVLEVVRCVESLPLRMDRVSVLRLVRLSMTESPDSNAKLTTSFSDIVSLLLTKRM